MAILHIKYYQFFYKCDDHFEIAISLTYKCVFYNMGRLKEYVQIDGNNTRLRYDKTGEFNAFIIYI